jgi:hypothetical protein
VRASAGPLACSAVLSREPAATLGLATAADAGTSRRFGLLVVLGSVAVCTLVGDHPFDRYGRA